VIRFTCESAFHEHRLSSKELRRNPLRERPAGG
jgi:hypothetical protein